MCRTLTLAEAEELCASITHAVNQSNDLQYTLSLTPVHSYRACAVIRGSSLSLSNHISNTDPAYPTEDIQRFSDSYESIYCLPLDETWETRATTAIVNDFVSTSEKVLATHPINEMRRSRGEPEASVVLTRGPGTSLPGIPPLSLKYSVSTFFIGDLPIELGAGALVGCQCLAYSSQAESSTPYTELLSILSQVLTPNALVAAHIKGPDEFGHDGDYPGKILSIEKIDQFVVCPILSNFGQLTIAVTSDHATPCAHRTHTAHAVPFAVRGDRIMHNGAKAFNEHACARLRSPIKKGTDLLPFIFRSLRGKTTHAA
jgi:2,3-bisphosphoglycerate-independent phosphoglycerate mutase